MNIAVARRPAATGASPEPVASTVSAGICPLCRRPNGCAMAAAGAERAGAPPCWCVAAVFAPAALAQASALDGGAACLCAACAAGAS